MSSDARIGLWVALTVVLGWLLYLLAMVIGVVAEFGLQSTLSRWHGRLARKRWFSRCIHEKAACVSAGLARVVLENRSRNGPAKSAEFREPPKRPFEKLPTGAKPRRCWIAHSLAYFAIRILRRPLIVCHRVGFAFCRASQQRAARRGGVDGASYRPFPLGPAVIARGW